MGFLMCGASMRDPTVKFNLDLENSLAKASASYDFRVHGGLRRISFPDSALYLGGRVWNCGDAPATGLLAAWLSGLLAFSLSSLSLLLRSVSSCSLPPTSISISSSIFRSMLLPLIDVLDMSFAVRDVLSKPFPPSSCLLMPLFCLC
jgi:hypothetical protein